MLIYQIISYEKHMRKRGWFYDMIKHYNRVIIQVVIILVWLGSFFHAAGSHNFIIFSFLPGQLSDGHSPAVPVAVTASASPAFLKRTALSATSPMRFLIKLADGRKTSNYGPHIDVVAPGVRIFSTSAASYFPYYNEKGDKMVTPDYGDSYYVMMDGTSMASPHVAGIAAMVN